MSRAALTAFSLAFVAALAVFLAIPPPAIWLSYQALSLRSGFIDAPIK
jgi:hypothetical protein